MSRKLSLFIKIFSSGKKTKSVEDDNGKDDEVHSTWIQLPTLLT